MVRSWLNKASEAKNSFADDSYGWRGTQDVARAHAMLSVQRAPDSPPPSRPVVHEYAFKHLASLTLLQELKTANASVCCSTARLIALIAEVEERKLYVPAAYDSMYAYCVGELHMSEDAACRRISVARTARHLPAIFEAIADGRLHLSAVEQMGPHLTQQNADELVAAAAWKTKAPVVQLLAERSVRATAPAGRTRRSIFWRRRRRCAPNCKVHPRQRG